MAHASLLSQQITIGRRVECQTVCVCKVRWRRLGLDLQGHDSQHPTIISSSDPRFQAGDIIYTVDGHLAYGARRTARRIRWKRNMCICLLRTPLTL